MKNTGSCHCGNILFEIEGEIKQATACNCSICQRRGSLLWFTPRTQLILLTPDDMAATYTFNQHKIKHRFCAQCGIHVYGEGVDPNGNVVAAINIRCIEDIDIDTISVEHFDGRAIE